MNKKYKSMLTKLDFDLNLLESSSEDVLFIAEEGIKITRKALKQLRAKVISNNFNSVKEEIEFFKFIKPKVYSKLIYYVKLFCLESKKPKGSIKSKVKYFNEQVNKLQLYFQDNLDFYHYYRRGATMFDEHYFLRNKANIRLFPDSFHFLTDEQFSTSHDSTVATIIAYDMLIVYLSKEIEILESNGNYINMEALQKQSQIVWTSPKIHLIELIYALHSMDVINNGSVSIKDIARVTERIFKVDLGDYYRAFLEIRMRKKGRTKFLDMLKENLEKRMNETDY